MVRARIAEQRGAADVLVEVLAVVDAEARGVEFACEILGRIRLRRIEPSALRQRHDLRLQVVEPGVTGLLLRSDEAHARPRIDGLGRQVRAADLEAPPFAVQPADGPARSVVQLDLHAAGHVGLRVEREHARLALHDADLPRTEDEVARYRRRERRPQRLPAGAPLGRIHAPALQEDALEFGVRTLPPREPAEEVEVRRQPVLGVLEARVVDHVRRIVVVADGRKREVVDLHVDVVAADRHGLVGLPPVLALHFLRQGRHVLADGLAVYVESVLDAAALHLADEPQAVGLPLHEVPDARILSARTLLAAGL